MLEVDLRYQTIFFSVSAPISKEAKLMMISQLFQTVSIKKRTYQRSSLLIDGAKHKVQIYRVPQCMFPRRNWDSPTPSLASECAPPPRNQSVGGAHSPAGEGLGESQFRQQEKRPSTLPTL